MKQRIIARGVAAPGGSTFAGAVLLYDDPTVELAVCEHRHRYQDTALKCAQRARTQMVIANPDEYVSAFDPARST